MRERPVPNMNKKMDVIGHDTPCEQLETGVVMVKQCLLGNSRDLRVPQMTCPGTAIQPFFQLRASFLRILD